MTSKLRTASIDENPAPASGAGFLMHLRSSKRKIARVARALLPQWLKTALITLLWLGLMSQWVSVTSLYVRSGNGLLVGYGLALLAAIGGHLWPTRTPPWRTVALVALLSTWLGSTLLVAGLMGYGLTITGVVSLLFLLARFNENGRKVFRALLRRPLARKV